MRIVALLLTAALALPAVAEDEDARREAATNYIMSDAQQQILNDMFAPEAMVGQFSALAPQMDEDVLNEIGQIAAEELAALRPTVEQTMIEAAVETFTLAEINALAEFYATPEGAAVMQKMQPFMQRAMTMLGPEMQEAQGRIMRRGAELMQGQ